MNLTWVLEQLFTIEAVVPLLKDKEPFAQVLQHAVSNNLARRSMDDLDACLTAYETVTKSATQSNSMAHTESHSTREREGTPTKNATDNGHAAHIHEYSQSSRKRSKH